jgi:putative thioredoxin
LAYDTDDFATDVIERSHTVPVLVDFWAEWCGPCKILGPVLERLADANDGEWELAKLNTENHQDIAGQYSIRSIPNVKLFVDGEVVNEFVGALPEPRVVDWLRTAIPSKYRAQLAGARQLLTENGASGAIEMLQAIVAAEPGNDEATVLLGQAFLGSDHRQAVEIVERVVLGSKHYEAAEAVKTLATAYGSLDNGQQLAESPVKEGYVAAIRDARSHAYEPALEGFLDVVRRDRQYDGDGARKAIIAIFKLLGEDHPLTGRYRRALSSALY